MTRHLPAALIATVALVGIVGLVVAVRGRREDDDEWGPGSCRRWGNEQDAIDLREYAERMGRNRDHQEQQALRALDELIARKERETEGRHGI